MNDITETLTERGERYGTFAGHAEVSQGLKRYMANELAKRNKVLADDQWESLEMIAHKIARIINGDADYVDSWVDIAGYAKLVADNLEGIER
jgi:signal-transduction protein with cAMP-binding, CBS, and nucleotidyltransferase domain